MAQKYKQYRQGRAAVEVSSGQEVCRGQRRSLASFLSLYYHDVLQHHGRAVISWAGPGCLDVEWDVFLGVVYRGGRGGTIVDQWSLSRVNHLWNATAPFHLISACGFALLRGVLLSLINLNS